MVFDADLLEADPRGHPAKEAVVLAHLVHDIDDLAVKQAEVPGIQRDFDVRDFIDQTVEHRRGFLLEPAFAVTFFPNRVNDFVALFPFLNQLQDHFRRVLQVRVDNDSGIAERVIQTGRHGNLVAEVPREIDAAHTRIFFRKPVHDFCGLVRRTVIDEDEFPGFAGPIHYFRYSCV